MKTLVVYDSVYGNTEKIAQAIGGAIAGAVKVLPVSKANPSIFKNIDLFIVGSPTQGGRPTPAMQGFLKEITASSLTDINIAAFDTRISTKWVGIFGYAAGKIAETLKKKGGTLLASPEGFFVTGTKGPLKEGELERAAAWATGISKSKK